MTTSLKPRSFRCLRCWGLMEPHLEMDEYECQNCGHVVTGRLYYHWYRQVKRPTGHVIGPAGNVTVLRRYKKPLDTPLDTELLKCPNCEMLYPTRVVCPSCILRPNPDCERCHGTCDVGPSPPHECPEPYPYGVARSIVEMAQAVGGIIITPRQKAAIRLGLRNPPESPPPFSQ